VHLFEGSVAYNVQKHQSINVCFVLKESEEICCTPFDYWMANEIICIYEVEYEKHFFFFVYSLLLYVA
jgi:hypothetical protein